MQSAQSTTANKNDWLFGAPSNWSPQPRYSQSKKDELHIGLDIPKQAATEIYNWVQEQDWPEGTELEPLDDYHITLLFAQGNRSTEHRGDDWIRHEKHAVTVKDIKEFPPSEEKDGLHPLVLGIESSTIHGHHNELAEGAEVEAYEATPTSIEEA